MPAETYGTGDIAQMLGRSSEWVREHREKLHARGMPRRLDMPGHPRYPRAQVDAWVRGYLGIASLVPANDAAPPAAPEQDQWQPFLRQVYANRHA